MLTRSLGYQPGSFKSTGWFKVQCAESVSVLRRIGGNLGRGSDRFTQTPESIMAT
jgi:hypothetical protein